MESLINLGSIGPGERTDILQSKQFIAIWNKRYPEYPTKIKMCPHDFGSYADVQIADRAFTDDTMFIEGVEEVACNLADELGLEY